MMFLKCLKQNLKLISLCILLVLPIASWQLWQMPVVQFEVAVRQLENEQYEPAFKRFNKLSQAEPKANYYLAQMYENGWYVDVDLKEAFELYKIFPRSSSALYDAGRMTLYGQGTSQNLTEAFELFREATDRGSVEARFMLGFCYMLAIGIQQDLNLAKMHLGIAARMDQPHATYMLGYIHEAEGNITKAQQFLQQAADLGYTDALVSLAGLQWLKSTDKGEAVFKELAQQNNIYAQFVLDAVQVIQDKLQASVLEEYVDEDIIEADLLLANFYKKNGDVAKAKSYIEHAISSFGLPFEQLYLYATLTEKTAVSNKIKEISGISLLELLDWYKQEFSS